MCLLLLQRHLLLLVDDRLLDYRIDLLDRRSWVISQQDLLLSLDPLLLLKPELLHLLLLVKALSDLFVSPWLLARGRCRLFAFLIDTRPRPWWNIICRVFGLSRHGRVRIVLRGVRCRRLSSFLNRRCLLLWWLRLH